MSHHATDGLLPPEEKASGAMVLGSSEATSLVPEVLVVDDEEMVRVAHRRILERAGVRVTVASSATSAIELLEEPTTRFDAILSDVVMPGMDGVELLREVRRRDVDIPVLLVTGNPRLDTAMATVNGGGFRYLPKPIAPEALIRAVTDAVSLRRLARLKREALALLQSQRGQLGDRASLEVQFAEALDGLWIAYQPIIDCRTNDVYGYEALVRSSSKVLGNPMLLFDAAERLGQVLVIGRRIRALVAQQAVSAPCNVQLFVNLHSADLDDPELLVADSPLARHANRVVLEVTERASLEDVVDVPGKVSLLRELGYRIAVDDLGAGYAGLASFTQLEPDIAKLDMSLVRGIDCSKAKQSLVRSMIAVCTRELRVEVVCEGVETETERDTLAGLGARLLQGYLYGRPSAGFELHRTEASSTQAQARCLKGSQRA